MKYLITNGRYLIGDELRTDVNLQLQDGILSIVDADRQAAGDYYLWDADNALVLPGMIDLHGDAFERQVLPRPGVHFPTDLALLETDRQMLANGITTAFHGITYSWEPGLRGHDNAFDLIEGIENLRPRLGCDTRIHLRWETHNLEGAPYVEQLLHDERIDLLAFNDHIEHISEQLATGGAKLSVYAHRTGLTAQAFVDLHETVTAQGDQVPDAVARLAKIAHQQGIVCASHDDETIESRRWYHDLHVDISEFPVNEEVAQASLEMGSPVILGAPNVVRNGSHCDRLNATTAVDQGLCNVLTSDYYYPSMLLAIFLLMQRNDMSLAQVWPLVSTNAAQAAKLPDRGLLKDGYRADVLLVDDSDYNLPQVKATFVDGKLVYASDHLAPPLKKAG
jgi:alpha-D-ribose 1-methylphosphonate 5-triphosphate diphosphatase